MTPRDIGGSDDRPDAEDFAMWQLPSLPGTDIRSKPGGTAIRLDSVASTAPPAAAVAASGSRGRRSGGAGTVVGSGEQAAVPPAGGRRRHAFGTVAGTDSGTRTGTDPGHATPAGSRIGGRRRPELGRGAPPPAGPPVDGRGLDGTRARKQAPAAAVAAATVGAGVGAATAGSGSGSGTGAGPGVEATDAKQPATSLSGMRERLGGVAAAKWAALTAAVGPGVREAVGPGAPPWRRWSVATSMLVPLALVFVACGAPSTTPTTAKVTRAGVSSKVTGTGALRAISEQNLGFPKGGQLEEVNVAVGQRVAAGTIVARINDFDAQSNLRKTRSALDREQAALERIRDGNQVEATSDDANSAEDVLDATKKQADEINEANHDAVEQADRRVAAARADLRRAEVAHRADQVRCSKSLGGDSRRKPGEVNQPGGLEGELFVPAPVESSACDRARESEAAVSQAADQVSEAIAAAQQAQQKRDTDKAAQRVAVENARRDARAASNEADAAEDQRPHDLDEQEAIVEEARADVSAAVKAVNDTVLRAPVDGTVAAINGRVGEYVGDGSPTTPQAPGKSGVSIPDVTTGVGPGLDTSKGDRPGGEAFLVLDNVSSFQVVVPFEESDAAKVQPNQRVEVTFDSVPDLTRRGTVVAVSPAGANIQDVTNYYVTIVLNELDPRLKEGQTAQANVIIGELNDVLVVPNSAVQQGGKTGVVTVLDPNGEQRQVQVQLGMSGDGVVQVLSGLREGELVVVPDQ